MLEIPGEEKIKKGTAKCRKYFYFLFAIYIIVLDWGKTVGHILLLPIRNVLMSVELLKWK